MCVCICVSVSVSVCAVLVGSLSGCSSAVSTGELS